MRYIKEISVCDYYYSHHYQKTQLQPVPVVVIFSAFLINFKHSQHLIIPRRRSSRIFHFRFTKKWYQTKQTHFKFMQSYLPPWLLTPFTLDRTPQGLCLFTITWLNVAMMTPHQFCCHASHLPLIGDVCVCRILFAKHLTLSEPVYSAILPRPAEIADLDNRVFNLARRLAIFMLGRELGS